MKVHNHGEKVMNGAREYATLLPGVQQHGKLYTVAGYHARGKTFHIYVLPSSEPIQGSIYSIKDAVEVYGITGGQPGWTETYGWLHRGKWEEDFAKVVQAARDRYEEQERQALEKRLVAADAEHDRINRLLSNY